MFVCQHASMCKRAKYTRTHPISAKMFDLTWPAVSKAWHAKSWLLEGVHHVVYCPATGFSAGLSSILRLSDIWCACCCRGIEHEFSPNCSGVGVMAVKLCVHAGLLIECRVSALLFFHRARRKLFSFLFLVACAFLLFLLRIRARRLHLILP